MNIRLTKPAGINVEKRCINCKDHSITVLVLSPEGGAKDAAGVLWIHGGGYITGMKEMVFMSRAADLVTNFGAVVISPGYRLAPLHPYPAAIEDCYDTLLWMKEHSEELHIRQDQIMAGGESAGGGLCAALCMMARDRGAVNIAFQMPLYPMLDNFDTDSSRDNHGRMWNTQLNHLGWKIYLRKDAKKEVSPYASPARQLDYSGLPPCYTFVGSGEPFYKETLTYAENLKVAGVEAKADVYPSNIHAFDMLYPGLDISRQACGAFLEAFAHAKDSFFAYNDINADFETKPGEAE